ncbi:MAG: hypothetical protein IT449_15905 [Phycisphaerales bacterium]|nr:hypothetical protein [Phycisphaerales bacterium]
MILLMFEKFRHFLVVASLLGLVGCRKPAAPTSPDPSGTAVTGNPAAAGEEGAHLTFPPPLRAADESVNQFIEEALRVSTGRDYDAFRLLWVTVDEPFAREQFERGWKSLKALRVEVLQKIRDPVDDSILYGLYAIAELDPSDLPTGQEASRRVVLEIRKEQDRWRLANARDEIRRAVIELYQQAHPASASPSPGAGGA